MNTKVSDVVSKITQLVDDNGVVIAYVDTATGKLVIDGDLDVLGTSSPNVILVYKGIWDASTNTPTLADGVGTAGFTYKANPGGTVNFGSGNITFDVGDYVIYNGTVWEKSDHTDAVNSVNGQTGPVVLDAGNIGFTPDGDIASTDVQSAIVEVRNDTDTKLAGKSNTGHTHVAADITNFQATVSANSDVVANTAARHTHANSAVLAAITDAGSGQIITATERTNHNSMYARHGQAESVDYNSAASGTLTVADTVVTYDTNKLTSPGVSKLAGNQNFEFQYAGRYRVRAIFKFQCTATNGNSSAFRGRLQFSANGGAFADIDESVVYWTATTANDIIKYGGIVSEAYIDIAAINPTKDRIRAVVNLVNDGGGTETYLANMPIVIEYLGDR